MMYALEFSLWAQGILCSVALLLNFLLALVVVRANRQEVGFYKWLLLTYCVFEMVYAAAVLQAMPIHVVFDHTWIFFSFHGPLIGTPVAFLASSIYCFFYEVWMVLVVVNFLYRYVCVCRHDWSVYVQSRKSVRCFLGALFASFLLLCIVCTVYLCAVNKMSSSMERKIKQDFGIGHLKDIGYTLLRLVDLEGNPSLAGITATAIHDLIVGLSAIIITFCSLKIWLKIKEMHNMQEKTNIVLEKQLFRTLLIQIIVPVLLCHIPSVAHLTFAFWANFPLDGFTPFFSVFTTIPKALDPIITFVCISEYRNGLRNLIGCRGNQPYLASQVSPGETAHRDISMI